MPDKLDAELTSITFKFRHPTIGMPDKLGRTQSVVLIVKLF